MSDVLTLHRRVRQMYADFAPAERRLADLILHFPGELHGYTGSELARLAKTSNAAVSRFVRRLGFANFEDMRVFARQESENGSPLILMGRQSGTFESDLLGRHAATVRDNIQRTFSGIDADEWDEIVNAIAGAKRVWVAGFRHGYFIAGYLRWSLIHARPAVTLLPSTGETFGETLVDATAEDIGVILAMRRRVPAVGALASALKTIGARVVLLTDSSMAETFGADWVVRCQSRSKGVTDDHSSAFAMTHALTEGVIERLGLVARERFADIDQWHERLSEFE